MGFVSPKTPKFAATGASQETLRTRACCVVSLIIWVTRQPLLVRTSHTPAAKGDPVFTQKPSVYTSTRSGRLRQRHTCIKGIIAFPIITMRAPGLSSARLGIYVTDFAVPAKKTGAPCLGPRTRVRGLTSASKGYQRFASSCCAFGNV